MDPGLLLTCLAAALAAGRAEPWNDEQRLVDDLMGAASSYDRRVRPVRNASEPVDVYLAFGKDVLSVVSLDSKMFDLYLIASISIKWEDPRLRWDPDDYGGLKYLVVDADHIWRPLLYILTSNEPTPVIDDKAKTLVTHNGTAYSQAISVIHSKCFISLDAFPFDRQVCIVFIGTNIAPAQHTRITPLLPLLEDVHDPVISDWVMESLTSHNYTTVCDDFGADWNAEGQPSLRPSVLPTPGRDCPYRRGLELYLGLRRQVALYVFTIIMPTTVLNVVFSAIFWVPPGGGERLSFGVSLLLGLVVFQLLVQGSMPDGAAGTVPLLMYFIVDGFLLESGGLLLASLTQALHTSSAGGDDDERGHSCKQNQVGCTPVQDFHEAGETEEKAQSQPKKKITFGRRRVAQVLDRLGFLVYLAGVAVNLGMLVWKATASSALMLPPD